MSDEKPQESPNPKIVRKLIHSVLPQNIGGGPHGLGDPEDQTLRKLERDVLIPKKIRERTSREKCVEQAKAFSECGKAAGFLVVHKCKLENKALWDCAAYWWKDKEFVDECTKEYLAERSEYRRTGVGVKDQQQRFRSGINY
ncbi:hypothetical protein HCN44_005519 [Aphidius gifuensis]|uniref:COX assembly mitochondrial protein n=1 Tax=Aphidius gifuensis TaxID=684658 RepID=A0A834Y3T3_APHGI|nr:COX assembly mitochondrial protein homolog [Aphidius gifuensis]KAF7997242.1 hypothetical protein HCN44_005519 [Aphidius gifuensis]